MLFGSDSQIISDDMLRGTALRLNYAYYMTKCINPALDRVLSLGGARVLDWFKTLARPKLRLRHLNYDALSLANKAAGEASFALPLYHVSIHRHDIIELLCIQSIDHPAHYHAYVGGVDQSRKAQKKAQTSMDQYTIQGVCEVCGRDAVPMRMLCRPCLEQQSTTLTVLLYRLRHVALKEQSFARICRNCTKFPQESALFVKHEMVSEHCCRSLDCAVFFERTRIVTRLEDYRLAVADVEED